MSLPDAPLFSRYIPEPTLKAFHRDTTSLVKVVSGPYGSGKTIGCLMDFFIRATGQTPFRGYRRSKWAFIRGTYQQLRDTTLKSFVDWFPPPYCNIKGDSPMYGTLKFKMPDGTTVWSEIEFLSIDNVRDIQSKFKSMELTGAYVNEMIELPKEVLEVLTGRIGRYPAKVNGGPSWSGIIADTNMPPDDHWFYDLFENRKPEGYALYRQPPALLYQDGKLVPNTGQMEGVKAAENVRNIASGFKYWQNMALGKDPDWIKVYILGEYGSIFDGLPVYQHYWNELKHVSKDPLNAYNNIPLMLGFDFGRTPCCVATQLTPKGQMLILREFTSDNMGIRDFANNIVKPGLRNHFPKITQIRIVADPAGDVAGQNDDITPFDILYEVFGVKPERGSNDVDIRKNAVVSFLSKDVDGQPGLLVDPSCDVARRGFNGGYQYKKTAVAKGGSIEYQMKPLKNHPFSDIHDSIAYACQLIDGEYTVANSRKRGQVRPEVAGGWGGWV